jgi:4-hydroxybenzoate polyprenyltransferase
MSGDRPARARWAALRTLIVHLRLPFQLLLAPVFLWGWLLAGGSLASGSPDAVWRFGLAFVSFHVFLYGGVTAFNSYYDRDEGPIGGLERPPTVIPEMLPFSLVIKAVGWVVAALVNRPFFLIYGGFLALSVAYSHPRPRLKARPIPSLLVVGGGQGTLAFLGGWAANRGEIASAAGPVGAVGALAATLLVLGLYPLTQIYQIAEDRLRGDRTIAVAWGPGACFRLALVCQGIGGLAMLAIVARYGWGDAALVGAAILAQMWVVARWAARFDPHRVLWNYRRAMRLNTATSSGLALYLGYHLVAG